MMYLGEAKASNLHSTGSAWTDTCKSWRGPHRDDLIESDLVGQGGYTSFISARLGGRSMSRISMIYGVE